MRCTIDLRADQVAWLREYSARHGVSRAEAIRRAVDSLLAADDLDHRRRVLSHTAGAWKNLGIDALDFQIRLRAEWDRDQPEEPVEHSAHGC